jgi:hypothetical protein
LIFGLIYVFDWFYGGMTQLFRLVTGLGFVCLAPEAFLNPINASLPLRDMFKSRSGVAGWRDWLAIAGVGLLVAGLALRWL